MDRTTRNRVPSTANGPSSTGRNAVVWIGRDRAVVVRDAGVGTIAEVEVPFPDAVAAMPLALAEVAHVMGAVDRVLVLGSPDLRTALEREIAAIGHHPESILDAQIDEPVDREALRASLRRLA